MVKNKIEKVTDINQQQQQQHQTGNKITMRDRKAYYGAYMRDSILRLLDEQGISANAISEKAGLNRGALGRFLSGQNPGLHEASVEALARAFGVSTKTVRGDPPPFDPPPEPQTMNGASAQAVQPSLQEISLSGVPRIGIVEARTWRPVDWYEGVDLGVIMGHDPTFPLSSQFGFTVQSDVMDKCGIHDGDDLTCIDPWKEDIQINPGDWVVIENLLSDLDLREITVLEVKFSETQWEFTPCSSNPKHTTLTVPLDADLENGGPVRIIAIVIGVKRNRKVTKRIDPKSIAVAPPTGIGHAVSAVVSAGLVGITLAAGLVGTANVESRRAEQDETRVIDAADFEHA